MFSCRVYSFWFITHNMLLTFSIKKNPNAVVFVVKSYGNLSKTKLASAVTRSLNLIIVNILTKFTVWCECHTVCLPMQNSVQNVSLAILTYLYNNHRQDPVVLFHFCCTVFILPFFYFYAIFLFFSCDLRKSMSSN